MNLDGRILSLHVCLRLYWDHDLLTSKRIPFISVPRCTTDKSSWKCINAYHRYRGTNATDRRTDT